MSDRGAPIYQEMDPSGNWAVIKKERYDVMIALGESCWVRVVAEESGDDRHRKGETMDDVIDRLADGEVMSDDRLDHLMLMMLARILIALLDAAPQPSPEPKEPAHAHDWRFSLQDHVYKCDCGATRGDYPFGAASFKD